MNVRRGTLPDTQILIEFVTEMALESKNIVLDPEIASKGVRHLLENPDEGQYYIAEIEGRSVGYLMVFFEWSDWRCGNIYYIETFYIIDEYKNQGVFEALYQCAYKDAESEHTAVRTMIEHCQLDTINKLKSLGMHESHYMLLEMNFE